MKKTGFGKSPQHVPRTDVELLVASLAQSHLHTPVLQFFFTMPVFSFLLFAFFLSLTTCFPTFPTPTAPKPNSQLSKSSTPSATPQPRIPLYANHVGPYNNPHETYLYFSLPLCDSDTTTTTPTSPNPDHHHHYKFPSIGEALEGMELVDLSLYDFRLGNTTRDVVLCEQVLDDKSRSKLKKAILQNYWYQLFLDELPMWGMVGVVSRSQDQDQELVDQTKNEVGIDGGSATPADAGADDGNVDQTKQKKKKMGSVPRRMLRRTEKTPQDVFVYTHQRFSVGYNRENRIVRVDLETDNPIQIFPPGQAQTIRFTYSVEWRFIDLPYSRRFERYLDEQFFEHKIHWFSIINSFLMVLFLAGVLVMVVIRTIRADIGKLNPEEDLGAFPEFGPDETVWKKLSSDVFRRPRFLGVFAALIGSGVQLILLVFLLILFSIIGTFYDDSGAMLTTFIVFYVLTAGVAGYYSGSYYVQHKGVNWIRTMLLTSSLVPGFLVAVFGIMDTFAILYRSSQAIPFLTVLIIFAVHSFLTTPLVFLGTILGRSFNSKANYPCRPGTLKRPIPLKPWYLRRGILVLAGGILPFGSIFIELYFIFSSFQTYKIYYVYGFFLAVFVILLIVTICVSIVLTYVQLISEDYRWHWTSFFVSASTGFYTFLYALWFYRNTNMTGIFQFVFYVCHCAQFSVGVGLVCGTMGFLASSVFIRQIYKGIRID